MWIETNKPPEPLPLTIGCMPVIFVGVGERDPFGWFFPTDGPEWGYLGRKIPDPILRPDIPVGGAVDTAVKIAAADWNWPPLTFPTEKQHEVIVGALARFADVRAVNYMLSAFMVVELRCGDGRVYERGCLPKVVGGRSVLYWHREEGFLDEGWNSVEGGAVGVGVLKREVSRTAVYV